MLLLGECQWELRGHRHLVVAPSIDIQCVPHKQSQRVDYQLLYLAKLDNVQVGNNTTHARHRLAWCTNR